MAPFFDTMIACSSCGCHARSSETACPECGASLRRVDGSVSRTAVAVLMGLTAAVAAPLGCADETGGGTSQTSQGGEAGVGGAYGGGPSVGGGGMGGFGGESGVGGAYGGGPSVGGATSGSGATGGTTGGTGGTTGGTGGSN